MKRKERRVEGRKVFALSALVGLLIAAQPLAADDLTSGTQLQSFADSIYETLTGGVVRAIIVVIFAGSAIAFAFNKDNEKIKHAMMGIMVGTGLLLAAQTVVGSLFKAMGKG
jgi:type IV secretory pathway VirB2 component (pilin)